jgi:hypothetical protein
MSSAPAYLKPYLDAAARHGAGFKSLLWATPRTQAVRFEALARSCQLEGRIVLDVGCGRADFLDFLLQSNTPPARYIGLEAIETLADAAEQKRHPSARIIRGDFVRQPELLDQNADVILFCGSLNTLGKFQIFQALAMAWKFTGHQLGFNFLCSPRLAAAPHLVWQSKSEMLDPLDAYGGRITVDDQYLMGDCTVAITKI